MFHGPFPALKSYVLGEFATSRHAYLLRPMSLYTISQKTINQYKPHFSQQNVANTNLEQLHKNFQSVNDSAITVQTVHESTFTAYVMEVRDPKRIRVAVTKYRGKVGQTVSDMVQENGAVAGVNGGAFDDAHFQGTGGIPKGITIANGQVVESKNDGSIIGFTQGGAMVAGMYSASQLQQMGVDEALTFGPILIQNGRDVSQNVGTWGYAPRTAVGQTKDGTVIFVVTDGRYIHGPNDAGASMQQLAQIMLQYHCYVAANLDGGSSATMVKDGKLVNQPTDVLGEREVATSMIIMPEQRGGAS